MKRTLAILPIWLLSLTLLPATPTDGERDLLRTPPSCRADASCSIPLHDPSRSNSQSCVGKHVRAGANLAAVSAAKPAGTTFCLAEGVFTISKTVTWQPGDRIIGAGIGDTLIRPAGVGQPIIGFDAPGNTKAVKFSRLDIGGFQADPSADCHQCGTAIIDSGGDAEGWIILSRVRCHDNGTVCIGAGWGNIRATALDCYGNGFHSGSLLDPTYRSASCVKMTRGSMTMRGSQIHDNFWNGIWCDYCDHTTWVIEDNLFSNNGHAGIQWEISGELSTDTALIRHNVIRNNGWQVSVTGAFTSAGLIISGGRNITVKGNTVGGNSHLDAPDGVTFVCCRGIGIWDDDRAVWDPNLQNVLIRDNDLNGDAILGCNYDGVTCEGNA
jgi:hypothetical protein